MTEAHPAASCCERTDGVRGPAGEQGKCSAAPGWEGRRVTRVAAMVEGAMLGVQMGFRGRAGRAFLGSDCGR